MRPGGISDNVQRIRDRIAEAALRSGRKPEEIKLVAVTKTVPAERVVEAVDAGVDLLGESYVQEAVRKRAFVGGRVRWHMIGHLQTNKAKTAVECFDVVETVDRDRIVDGLQQQAARAGKELDVLVQVNLSGEATKTGSGQEGALSLIDRIASCANLRCRGLMAIPAFFDDPEGARPFFAALRELRDRLRAHCPAGVVLDDLSMGMSGDFEVAVEEGATIVRIGTALFGPR